MLNASHPFVLLRKFTFFLVCSLSVFLSLGILLLLLKSPLLKLLVLFFLLYIGLNDQVVWINFIDNSVLIVQIDNLGEIYLSSHFNIFCEELLLVLALRHFKNILLVHALRVCFLHWDLI